VWGFSVRCLAKKSCRARNFSSSCVSNQRLTIVSLGHQEFFKELERSTGGGSVYGALPAHCVIKARAQDIYAGNAEGLTRLGPNIAGHFKARHFEGAVFRLAPPARERR